VAARAGWSGLAAVRNHRVIGIDDSVASRWGPRIVDFVRAVGKALRRSA
jgi:iron complex transport system substrate-binding protein